MLAVPVLAGSAAYAVSELFHWRASLEDNARRAPKFYSVLTAATLVGVGLNLVGIDPMRALFWSAVVNGIVAVPLMFLVMFMSSNPTIVKQFSLPRYLRITGWIATVVMLLASLLFLASVLRRHTGDTAFSFSGYSKAVIASGEVND